MFKLIFVVYFLGAEPVVLNDTDYTFNTEIGCSVSTHYAFHEEKIYEKINKIQKETKLPVRDLKTSCLKID